MTSRGFIIKHYEHKEQVGVKRSISTFYSRYPSMVNVHAKLSRRKGFFENLKLFIVIGFVSKDNVICCENELTTSIDKKGFFSFNDDEKKKINKLNMRGRTTTVSKKMI